MIYFVLISQSSLRSYSTTSSGKVCRPIIRWYTVHEGTQLISTLYFSCSGFPCMRHTCITWNDSRCWIYHRIDFDSYNFVGKSIYFCNTIPLSFTNYNSNSIFVLKLCHCKKKKEVYSHHQYFCYFRIFVSFLGHRICQFFYFRQLAISACQCSNINCG